MSKRLWIMFPGWCGLVMLALYVVPALAQTEVKEKPPMYTYVADWQIPRAHWGEMSQANAADKKILDKALADGTIVGYGNDETVVHQPDGATHDDWWSSTSMAGLMKVLDQFSASGNTSSPVLASATKHWDSIFVSRHYNWHSGSYKNGYTHESSYKLKADASDDAVELVSKQFCRTHTGKAASRWRGCRIRNRHDGHSQRRAGNFLDRLYRSKSGRP